jgi:hypothetical protein
MRTSSISEASLIRSWVKKNNPRELMSRPSAGTPEDAVPLRMLTGAR